MQQSQIIKEKRGQVRPPHVISLLKFRSARGADQKSTCPISASSKRAEEMWGRSVPNRLAPQLRNPRLAENKLIVSTKDKQVWGENCILTNSPNVFPPFRREIKHIINGK